MTDRTQRKGGAIDGRPKSLSEDDRRDVADALVKGMIKDGVAGVPEERMAVADIVRTVTRRYLDGYEIAKRLEARGWDCDLDLADALDAWSALYEEKLTARQNEWAATVDFGPPLTTGTRVQAVWGGETCTGKIVEVYRWGPAQYVVAVDGHDHSDGGGAIVNFENVAPITADADTAAAGEAAA